jgi:hypothetical protein
MFVFDDIIGIWLFRLKQSNMILSHVKGWLQLVNMYYFKHIFTIYILHIGTEINGSDIDCTELYHESNILRTCY